MRSIDHFAPHVFPAEQGEGLFRSHSHESDEITLILKGEGYYTSQGQNVPVAAGDLILIPSALFHGFVCLKAWKGISVHYSGTEIPAYCQFLLEHAYQQNPGQILIARLSRTHLARVVTAIRLMEEESSRERVHDLSCDLMRNALETVLLSYHMSAAGAPRLSKTNAATERDDTETIQDALQEIHRTYHTPLKIADLAARHFLSESIFRKKFAAYTGVSPKQYIISLRLKEAKRLLRHTHKPIEFISSEVGFTSSSRFHDLFVKHVGATPLEWRKQARQ
ncbi:helix-turn-helix domain-containing protein [Gordoniibacillus kamchatkensis]|uniref:helix-turn-helix domain-containing protein n=1 Tax=Gordoniibacillus kamchatkensis TaxID=1590651 RepID=UPI001E3468EB|nr:AraC family transcriptional regulator [Paenibacillus sp. VKM B-2647]